jgi:hypothetical protein
MSFLPRRIELPFDMAIQYPHHADPGEHRAAGAASVPGRRPLAGRAGRTPYGSAVHPQTGHKGRHRLPTIPTFGALSACALWNTRRRFDPSSSPSASLAAAAYSLREIVGNKPIFAAISDLSSGLLIGRSAHSSPNGSFLSVAMDFEDLGREGLGFGRCTDDTAKIFVGCGTADNHRSFNLETENPRRSHVIEFDNKIIHGVAMALLLNGDTRDETRLASSSPTPQKLGKIVCDNGVLVTKPGAAGQLGRCWLAFRHASTPLMSGLGHSCHYYGLARQASLQMGESWSLRLGGFHGRSCMVFQP